MRGGEMAVMHLGLGTKGRMKGKQRKKFLGLLVSKRLHCSLGKLKNLTIYTWMGIIEMPGEKKKEKRV